MQKLKMQKLKMQKLKMQKLKMQKLKMQKLKTQKLKMQKLKMQKLKMQKLKMLKLKMLKLKMLKLKMLKLKMLKLKMLKLKMLKLKMLKLKMLKLNIICGDVKQLFNFGCSSRVRLGAHILVLRTCEFVAKVRFLQVSLLCEWNAAHWWTQYFPTSNWCTRFGIICTTWLERRHTRQPLLTRFRQR